MSVPRHRKAGRRISEMIAHDEKVLTHTTIEQALVSREQTGGGRPGHDGGDASLLPRDASAVVLWVL